MDVRSYPLSNPYGQNYGSGSVDDSFIDPEAPEGPRVYRNAYYIPGAHPLTNKEKSLRTPKPVEITNGSRKHRYTGQIRTYENVSAGWVLVSWVEGKTTRNRLKRVTTQRDWIYNSDPVGTSSSLQTT